MALDAHLDFETRSTTELKRSGVHRYVEDVHTAPWGFSYRMDDGAVKRWKPGEALPKELVQHIRDGGTVKAHNASFERNVWNGVVVPRYAPAAPMIRPEQQSCTLARASALALPPDLDRLAEVLGVEHQKDTEGAALMRHMMKPRRVVGDAVYWNDEPEKVERLALYCDGDVYAETDIDHALPPLTASEQEVWVLDQHINDRGVKVDMVMVVRATELIAYAKIQADAEMQRLTGGVVPASTNIAKIVAWLNARGIPCERMRKGDQDDLIVLTEIYDDPVAKAVIELRRTSAKTSVAKYEKILECVCANDRLYDLLQYHGARTGRWAGRLVQPQNYPRVDAETEAHYVEFVVQLLHSDMPISEVYELIELIGPPKSPVGERIEGVATLSWLSKALRSTIICEDDAKLVGGDFSNIEGRITAWLSGEQWKLDAFRAYDAGTGPDLYKLAYATSFGVALEAVTKQLRQIGKVEELALGFQGGVGAFYTMTLTYMVQLHKIVEAVYAAVPREEWDAMYVRFAHAKDKVVYTKAFGRKEFLPAEWTALKIVVTKWRKAHPHTVQGWWDLQDAAIQAVEQPGTIIPIYDGKARYLSDGNFLYCALPSGRCISYAQPHIVSVISYWIFDGVQWIDCSTMDEDEIEYLRARGYEIREQRRAGVRFWGLDEEKRWRLSALYGGYQCENIVQATARDVMERAMRRAEAYGYPLVLTVHDELLAEPLDLPDFSKEGLEAIMSIPEPWMAGLPVAAAAWEDRRYVK